MKIEKEIKEKMKELMYTEYDKDSKEEYEINAQYRILEWVLKDDSNS